MDKRHDLLLSKYLSHTVNEREKTLLLAKFPSSDLSVFFLPFIVYNKSNQLSCSYSHAVMNQVFVVSNKSVRLKGWFSFFTTANKQIQPHHKSWLLTVNIT